MQCLEVFTVTVRSTTTITYTAANHRGVKEMNATEQLLVFSPKPISTPMSVTIAADWLKGSGLMGLWVNPALAFL